MKFCSTVAVLLVAVPLVQAAEPAPGAQGPNWQTCCGTGQELTLAVSPLETASTATGAQVLVAKEVGRWDQGESHATFTALSVRTAAGKSARGLRIDLSRPGVTETVFAEESVFPLLLQIMQIYSANLPGPQSVSPRNPTGLFWNQLFDYDAGTYHPLAVAVYYDPAAKVNGLTMGRAPMEAGSKGMFDFPKILPQDFASIIDAGIAAISPGKSTP